MQSVTFVEEYSEGTPGIAASFHSSVLESNRKTPFASIFVYKHKNCIQLLCASSWRTQESRWLSLYPISNHLSGSHANIFYILSFRFFFRAEPLAHVKDKMVRTHSLTVVSMQILPRGTTLCSVKPKKKTGNNTLTIIHPQYHLDWPRQWNLPLHSIVFWTHTWLFRIASPTNHFVLTMCFCLFGCLYRGLVMCNA